MWIDFLSDAHPHGMLGLPEGLRRSLRCCTEQQEDHSNKKVQGLGHTQLGSNSQLVPLEDEERIRLIIWFNCIKKDPDIG